ncbi:MAG: outer membrane protein [Pseudorhodoplanes sp.]
MGHKTTRIRFLGAALAIALPSAAFAADMPLKAPVYTPPGFTWDGCYIGASGGGTTPESREVPVTGDPNLLISQDLGNAPRSLTPTGNGILVGGQVGCNRQLQRLVLGVELDASYVDAQRTFETTQGPNVVTTHFSQDLKYLATLRGRMGYAVDRLLFYGTAGLAFGEVEATASAGDAAGTSFLTGSQSQTQLGYTVGGGVEWAFAPNWSLKGEYLYYDLGGETLTINAVVGIAETANFNYETTGHVFRAGLNYRF